MTKIFCVGSLYFLLACTTSNDPETVAEVEIAQINKDSITNVKHIYIQMYGSGKTDTGWISRFLSQKEYFNKPIPFTAEIAIANNEIVMERKKNNWKDTVEIFFVAQLDVNGDSLLCASDFRTTASRGRLYYGLTSSPEVHLEVTKIADTTSCEQLYP